MLSAVFKVLALAAVALAIPATDSQGIAGAPDAASAPNVVLCTGHLPNGGCTTFTFTDSKCIDFKGAKKAYYKTLTGVSVPAGYICILYKEFSCNSEPEDYGILNAGNYNLDVDLVPNGAGDHVSFNEQTAAIICDPIVG